MKSKFITFVMGLLLAGSALADAGNSVYIDQTNADNSTVSITQSGQGNMVGDPNNVANPQFTIDGNNMNLTIVQDGVQNSITGNFIGGDSVANINQTGDFNNLTMNYGNMGSNGGTLGIAINGNSNATTLNIGTTGDASGYNYSLNIAGPSGGTGSNNVVTSTINSKSVTTSIDISGNTNTITTNQSGKSGHNLAISNIGNNNAITVTQDNATNPNSAIVNVTGNSAIVNVTQH
jgi:hypothetical protein